MARDWVPASQNSCRTFLTWPTWNAYGWEHSQYTLLESMSPWLYRALFLDLRCWALTKANVTWTKMWLHSPSDILSGQGDYRHFKTIARNTKFM